LVQNGVPSGGSITQRCGSKNAAIRAVLAMRLEKRSDTCSSGALLTLGASLLALLTVVASP